MTVEIEKGVDLTRSSVWRRIENGVEKHCAELLVGGMFVDAVAGAYVADVPPSWITAGILGAIGTISAVLGVYGFVQDERHDPVNVWMRNSRNPKV